MYSQRNIVFAIITIIFLVANCTQVSRVPSNQPDISQRPSVRENEIKPESDPDLEKFKQQYETSDNVFIRAWGSGQWPDEESARSEAFHNAKVKIAQQLQDSVSAKEYRFSPNLKTVSSAKVSVAFTQVSISYASLKIEGVRYGRTIKRIVGNEIKYYAGIEYPQAAWKERIKNELEKTLSNKELEALKKEAAEAWRQLEEDIRSAQTQ